MGIEPDPTGGRRFPSALKEVDLPIELESLCRSVPAVVLSVGRALPLPQCGREPTLSSTLRVFQRALSRSEVGPSGRGAEVPVPPCGMPRMDGVSSCLLQNEELGMEG